MTKARYGLTLEEAEYWLAYMSALGVGIRRVDRGGCYQIEVSLLGVRLSSNGECRAYIHGVAYARHTFVQARN